MKRIVALTAWLTVLVFCNTKSSATGNDPVIKPETAVSTNDFLNSIGVNSSLSKRGEDLQQTIEFTKYLGVRWFRTGYEDNVSLDDLIKLNKETNARFSYGLLSGGNDIGRIIKDAKVLASAGALLALEGPNEPNNWGITYQGEKGGRNESWLPVAKLQKDLYKAVKSDPELKTYPVFSLSEGGAQTDNTGLQFLTIPDSANTLMPAGTQYADFANCHNYVCHPSWPGVHLNQTWVSSAPSRNCPVDGLYGNYGSTWGKHFPGYTEQDLVTLPRVTTETGIAINKEEGITEKLQAAMYMNLYLCQFKQGWTYTAIYLLKARSNEPAHESFSFYNLDGSPKLAAHYLHNLTTILADDQSVSKPGKLAYSILNKHEAVHDLLLQNSNRNFQLVVWGELYTGGSTYVSIRFDQLVKKINVYDPTVGTKVFCTFSEVGSIALPLSDHPLILEIEQ